MVVTESRTIHSYLRKGDYEKTEYTGDVKKISPSPSLFPLIDRKELSIMYIKFLANSWHSGCCKQL